MSDDAALLKASDRELLLATVSPPASRAKPRTPLLTFVYVAIAALGNNLFGYELSVISAAKLDFANEFNISTDSAQYGLLASGLPIGATLGAVLAGYLQSIAGRRYTLAIASAIYCGAVIVSYYSSGFLMLAWGRLQTGVAVGLFSSTAPLYIAEIAPSHIRGKLVTFNQVLVVFGVLLGYAACKLFSPQWRLMFVAGLPLAALLLLAFIFVTPYSPRWLMTKGREREARAVLNALRGGTIVSGTGKGALLEAEGRGGAASIVQHGKGAISDIDSAVGAELEGMRRAVAGAATTTQWDQLREPWVLKAIFVGVFLAFIQQWCGVNAANAYAPDILKNAGFSAADALTQGIYIGVVKLVTIFIALGLMDRFGRRELLLVGTAGGCTIQSPWRCTGLFGVWTACRRVYNFSTWTLMAISTGMGVMFMSFRLLLLLLLVGDSRYSGDDTSGRNLCLCV